MHARFWFWLALAASCVPAYAANPTFAELLAKAEAQYDAGHRWSPPGDNMVETVATMMDMISTATPQQLAELSALLAKGAAPPPEPEKPGPTATAPSAVAPPSTPPKPPPQASAPPEPPPQASAPPQPSPQPSAPPEPAPQASASPKSPPQASISPQPSPQPSAPPKPSPQASARAADLLARGKEAEALGNVSGARRLYASAATLGNAGAALGLGRLYDPAFLKQSAMGGIEPDPALARYWYQRAAALGDPEAGRLLEALTGR